MDRTKQLFGVLGGLLAGLALMAALFAVLRALWTPAPPPVITKSKSGQPTVPVTIRSTVSAAQIYVDGERCAANPCTLAVRPGLHQAEARQAGHQTAFEEFAAQAGAADLQLELNPQPLEAEVEINSELMSGTLRLDDEPAVRFSGGSARLGNLTPGPHKLRFSSGGFQADFEFETQPGAPVRMTAAPKTKGLRAIAVAGAGPVGRIWVTDQDAELSIGARELGLVPEEGLPLPTLTGNVHKFVLRTAKLGEAAFPFEMSERPNLWISLRSNRKLGTILIQTGEDDVKVIVDGKDTAARTRRGKAAVLAEPGVHTGAVEKPGFLSPPERQAKVDLGSEATLDFRLEPIPTRAMLPIQGAPPGAVFTAGGRTVATAGADGTATIGDLSPGALTLTARRDGYAPGRWDVKLGAGRNEPLRAAMTRAAATLRVHLAGSGARLTVRRMGEFEESPLAADTPVTLPEGTYTVTATDGKNHRASTQVRLEAGRETTATLTLGDVPVVQEAAAPVKQVTLEDWARSPGWRREEGGAVVRDGGGIQLVPAAVGAQSVQFAAETAGGKAVRWITQYRDNLNYTLYEFSGDALERVDIVGGKRLSRNRSPVSERGAAARIRMTQQGSVLRTSALIGGQWVDLDTADTSNGTGRFGFYVPGRERLVLREFRYDYR
ncbi:MAG: PEGA domain-containing protein [Bryobacterales bacterium]|nr:PEGA domain-containing protein [Bryobacterales bacterium]